MSDMREDVTRAVAEAIINVPGNSYDTLGPKGRAFYGKAGDAAIETVFDGLIEWAGGPRVLTRDMVSREQAWREFADELRAKKAEVLGEQ